jgi:hypothetical protein
MFRGVFAARPYLLLRPSEHPPDLSDRQSWRL